MSSAMKGVRGTGPRVNRRQSVSGTTMEAIEPRRMMTATVVSTTGDTFSELSGTYFGAVMYGDNGYVDGVATERAGSGSQTYATSYTTWDANPDDGIDSGLLSFGFAVNQSGTGGGSLGVEGSSGLTFSTGSGGTVHGVTIQADVTGPYMQMSWEKVTVCFYRGGQLAETVDLGALTAGSLDGTTEGPSEALVTVNANASDYDGICITGKVRLAAAEGVYPNVTDIFGKVTIS